MTAFAGYPILVEDRVQGVLALFSRTALAVETVELLENLVRVIALAVERKGSEDRVRASEAWLSDAQRIAHLGNWEIDVVRDKLSWSDEVFRIFELDPATSGLSNELFFRCVHPGDRAVLARTYADSVRSRQPYETTYRLLMPDGRVKWIHEVCHTDYAPDGTALRSRGWARRLHWNCPSQRPSQGYRSRKIPRHLSWRTVKGDYEYAAACAKSSDTDRG